MRLSPHHGLSHPRLLVAFCFSFQIESSLLLERQFELDRTRLRRFFNTLSDRFGRFAADRVFEFQPGRLVDPLQLVPFFADLLNSLLRQAGVADTRTEQSDHPEARSLFFPADPDQGQAVIGRINRLRIGPVPASDLEVERTRYDRLENPIATSCAISKSKPSVSAWKPRPAACCKSVRLIALFRDRQTAV